MPEDFRPMYCHVGCLTKADGSAQLSQGRTTIVAGVYGPIEVRRSRERPDKMDVEVTFVGRVGQSSVEARAQEVLIRQVTEAAVITALHPRSGVNLSLHCLEEDAGLTGAAVNAACLALADSGIAMKCLFAAVTVAVIDNDEIVIDPDAKKLRKATEPCVVLFVFESRNHNAVATHIEDGQCSESKFRECLGLARKASSNMFDFYREIMKRKFSKDPL